METSQESWAAAIWVRSHGSQHSRPGAPPPPDIERMEEECSSGAQFVSKGTLCHNAVSRLSLSSSHTPLSGTLATASSGLGALPLKRHVA